jgi:hypothetical protein
MVLWIVLAGQAVPAPRAAAAGAGPGLAVPDAYLNESDAVHSWGQVRTAVCCCRPIFKRPSCCCNCDAAVAAADMLATMNPAMIEGMLTSLQAMDDSSLKEVGPWSCADHV